jgi:hypothetical protein
MTVTICRRGRIISVCVVMNKRKWIMTYMLSSFALFISNLLTIFIFCADFRSSMPSSPLHNNLSSFLCRRTSDAVCGSRSNLWRMATSNVTRLISPQTSPPALSMWTNTRPSPRLPSHPAHAILSFNFATLSCKHNHFRINFHVFVIFLSFVGLHFACDVESMLSWIRQPLSYVYPTDPLFRP